MSPLQTIRFYVSGILGLLIIFNWHFYGALMVFSIYLFLVTKISNFSWKYAYLRKSMHLLFFSTFFSLPIWNHFSRTSFAFNVNTVETILPAIQQMYAVNRGFPKGVFIQNISYAFMLATILVITILILWSFFQKNNNFFYKPYRDAFIKINILLVVLPACVIFLLDYITRYRFLLRQFAWVMLPLYISIGVILSGIKFTNDPLRYRKI